MTGEVDDRVAKLERRLQRSRAENEILEKMIEDKTRSLYLAQAELQEGKRYLENVLASMSSAVMITDRAATITSIGGTTARLTGLATDSLTGRCLFEVLADTGDGGGGQCGDDGGVEGPNTTLQQMFAGPREGQLRTASGTVPVLLTTSPLTDDEGDVVGAVCVATDLSERKRLEVELRHAQRLESIGQLAAGVAHEINTPIQFVGDSARFVGEAFEDLSSLIEEYRKLKAAVAGGPGAELVAAIDELEDEIDLEFIEEEAPKAVARALDGIDRVADIVKAMKQFSHPGDDAMAPADLNQLVETALTVAKNEYKYVADIELALGDIPDVLCNQGDLSQVLLNLVVNAAHAIADRVAETGENGRITVGSCEAGDGVSIRIADTGGGIPVEIRERVMEPFFTTKEPGKGTGQGLALAHNIVVNKHGGRLDFEVEDGVGTTFTMWLPRKATA